MEYLVKERKKSPGKESARDQKSLTGDRKLTLFAAN